MTQLDQSTQAPENVSSKIENWLLSNGTLVDHFSIIRPLGKGGMAEVYLARDTKLGRKVALKIVKPETLGSKEAIERFLFEARATARFNHPHIVTIYAVGEDHSRPYVALEYLEGQSLRQRMDDQKLSQKEAVRIGLAIAEALREAHGGDILHRDLKPENVILVKDGRLRVLDFGLAGVLRREDKADKPENMRASVILEPHSGKQAGIQGTPAYMAPEQWEEKPETGAVDIWALGVILYEMVSGRRPYDESSSVKQAARVLGPYPAPALSGDIPTELASLIMECLHKEPGKRLNAARVVRRLSQFLVVDQEAEAIDESPFRGLLSFDERHRHFFFGRDSEIAAFVERLRQQPVLLVVGPSGAGKSSFVQAGVIPRLRERGPLIVLQIRPGNDPFLVLASRIVSARRQAVKTNAAGPFGSGQLDDQGQTRVEDAISEAERLTQQLRDSPHLLNLVLHRLAEQRQGNVILFVDQLEELYTLVTDALTRRLFMQSICTAADDPEMPVRVIFTVREEFLSRLAEGASVREVLSQIAVLRSPDKGSLREILSRPVEAVGFSYEDQKMVEEMVSDVEGEVSPLPLLQFAGRTLWDRRDNEQRALKRSVYESMGGVAGALAQHADGVLAGMSAGELALARSLLLRLVTAEGTRQVLPRSRLLDGLEQRAEDVLKRLTLARLITTKQSEIEDEAELELVHESLIATWGRLARWIDESREEMVFLAEVTQAAQLWEKRGRRAEEVWRGDALREARRAVRHCTPDVPSQIKRFLDAGQRKELSRSWRNRSVVVVAFIALIAMALIFMAKERETSRQKEVAEQERAVAQREGATTALLQGDVLEARAKLRASMEALDSVSGRALWARLKKTPLIWKKELPEVIHKMALAPDGKTIAVAIFGGWVVLIDTATATTHMFRAYKEGYVQPYFSPDGETLAYTTEIGQIGMWNLETHKLRTLAAHSKAIIQLAYSPDGRYLASASEDKTVRLWDVQSGAERKLGSMPESVTYVLAFDPQGKYLAAAGNGKKIRLWDLKGSEEEKTFEFETEYIHRLFFGPQGKQLFSVGKTTHIWDIASGTSRQLPVHKIPAFSPDGRLLVRRAEDGSLFVWDVEKETVHSTLEESREKIYQAEFSQDKKLVVAAGTDSIIRVWRIPSGQKWMQLEGHKAQGTGLLFTPDGRHLISGGWDKTVRFWDLSSQASQPVKRGPGDQVIGIDYSPDGTRLAVSGFDRVVRIWDSASGRELAAFEGHTATVWNLDYSPDGSQVATAAHDNTVRIWDVKNFSSSGHKVLKGHESMVYDVCYSPDGKLLASAATDGTIRLWDPETGKQKKVIKGGKKGAGSLAFSPDGKRLASCWWDYVIRIHDVESGQVLKTIKEEDRKPLALAFSPDGKYLVSGDYNGKIELHNLKTGSVREIGRHWGWIYKIVFHPDGKRIATASRDDTARIWDLQTGQYVEFRGHNCDVNRLAFHPSGRYLATGGDDATVRIWNVNPYGSTVNGGPVWRAPLLISTETSPVELYSHRGWTEPQADSTKSEAQAAEPDSKTFEKPGKWRRAVETARLAAATDSGQALCIVTMDDQLQLWDLATDQNIFKKPVEGVNQLLAIESGCAVLKMRKVQLFKRSGDTPDLGYEASAMAWDSRRQELLMVAGNQVLVFDSAGKQKAAYNVGRGVTALARVDDPVKAGRRWILLGKQAGNIEVVMTRPVAAGEKPLLPLRDVPRNSIVLMLEGPRGTLVLGYANGQVGIWDLANGARLEIAKLHGPLAHLHIHDQKLYAVTELGDYLVWDLSIFRADYCSLVRDMWDKVPVVWQAGRPTLLPRPEEHRCRASKARTSKVSPE